MKSSTIRRANLTKEKIAVLEALAKYRRQTYERNPSATVQPIKERELDVLWQNFKTNSKNDKSPGIYLATGFIAGAVVMLLITTILSFSVKTISTHEFTPKEEVKIEDTDITFIPADNTITAAVPSNTETYTVQPGDTLESIIIRFYGSYSSLREDKIKSANNLRNPNSLQIGQKLIIPLH